MHDRDPTNDDHGRASPEGDPPVAAESETNSVLL